MGDGQEVIKLGDFTGRLDQSLERAKAGDTPLDVAMEEARGVIDQLAAVEAGRLVVHPPLSAEQGAAYHEKAETVLAIGQKAAAGLARASTGRGSLLSRLRSGSSRRYQGQGAAAKS